jgi:hypothetical protein
MDTKNTDFCVEATFDQIDNATAILRELLESLDYMATELADCVVYGSHPLWGEADSQKLDKTLGEWSLSLPAVRAAAVNLERNTSEGK